MLLPESHKRHKITLRGETRTCMDAVKKKRKRAFARNRTRVAQLGFSQSNRETYRFSFVKASVHFFPSEIHSEAETISHYGMSRSLSRQDVTAETSASYCYRNFATSFPNIIFTAWVIFSYFIIIFKGFFHIFGKDKGMSSVSRESITRSGV